MNMHKLNIDGREITFLNAWHGTRSGFMHETEMYIDSWQASDARRYYINRTWERYSYQSVMLEAVFKLQEEEKAREKRRFLEANGFIKMMKHREPAFNEYLASNKTLAFYKQIEEALR